MISRVLKGLGRLVLTTTVLFSVGLFLCSSEVKAATEEIKAVNNGGDIEIRFTNGVSSAVDVTKVKIEFTGTTEYEEESFSPAVSVTADAENALIYKFDKTKFVNVKYKSVIEANNELSISKITLTVAGADKSETAAANMAKTNPIRLVKVAKNIDKTKHNVALASYTLGKLSIGESPRDYKANISTIDGVDYYVGYGYENEKAYIKTSGVDASKYFENFGDGSAEWHTTNAFKEAGGEYTESIGTGDITRKFQYFPAINLTVNNTTAIDIHLDENGKYLNGAVLKETEVPFTVAAVSGESADLEVINAKVHFTPQIVPPATGANITKWGARYDGTAKKAYFTLGEATGAAKVMDESKPSSATICIATTYTNGTTETEGPELISKKIGAIPLNVYACPTGIGLDNSSSVTTYVKQTETYNLTIVPGGADPNWNYYAKDGKFLTISNVGKSADYVTVSYAGNSPVIKITGKKKGTGVKLQLKLNNVPEKGNQALTSEVTIDVEESTDIDEENTEKYINSTCDKNYITVGYKLDLNKLIIDNCRNGAGNKVSGLTNSDIYGIEYDDEDKGKKIGKLSSSTNKDGDDVYTLEGVAEGVVTLNVDVDSASLAIKVYVYPKPTATYSSSAHTLKVTIPTKISTGYADTNTNINAGKGFYLALENGSGEQIADYDKTKYQTIISTLKDYSAEYTVTASDIESLVTTAASNGKFSGDTNSVKFKIIPMGYKQGTSNEVVTAKDELAVKSDATTVYRVKSSGEGFNESYGYGLDGQTVTLTASPKSGYTFSKWSDNVANNPRSVKVAASGTRDFTAVAKETPAGAAGSGAGGDNSSLYDDVPKTAESNSAIWLIVFMVFAVMGTAYALYLQLTAATSKHGK